MEWHPLRDPRLVVAAPIAGVFLVGMLHTAVAMAALGHASRFGLRTVQSDAKTVRAQTLARLRGEVDAASHSRWTMVDGCRRVPEIPAAMVGMGSRLFVATEDRLESYDVEKEAWEDEFIRLPEHVGSGVSLVGDGDDTIYLASGGDRRTLWAVSIRDRRVRQLPEPVLRVGRGAALAYGEGELYLAPGQRQRDLLGLEEGASGWRDMGPIGGEGAKVETSFGRSSGFLARLGAGLYAWPDHHIQRFDVAEEDWFSGTWLAMGFRPSLDGGGVVADDALGSIYSMCGKYSRSLNEISPSRMRKFYYVRPRLPYPMIGEGSRVAIARKKGIPHLFVYAVEPDNKLCHIPCSELTRLTKEDNVADEESPWRRVHTPGGGSGVRRRKDLGSRIDLPRARGTLAAMGALGAELFFMRLANVRRIQPETGTFTYYPGINVGRHLALGAAGAYDGERYLYMCTGRSTYFLRWDVPKIPPMQKGPASRRPVDETDLEILSPLPAEVGRGAALSHHDGMIYAMPGALTRDFWRYVVAEKRWDVLAPLPAAAAAMGDRGTGLVATESGVYAIPDEHVWRYDVEAKRWAPFADLDFALDWDGGMVTNDGERYLYVVRGDISTRFGRLDLRTRRFEELLPRPPDAISAEGNRLAVLTIDGERRLYVHRGHNSNEILWIRIADLEPRGE